MMCQHQWEVTAQSHNRCGGSEGETQQIIMLIIEYEMKRPFEKEWIHLCGEFDSNEHFVQFELNQKHSQDKKEIRNPKVTAQGGTGERTTRTVNRRAEA